MTNELLLKIREVEPIDRENLSSVSYSKLDLFEQCAMRYKLKYVDKKSSFNPSVATEVGSLLHKILEIKARNIMEDTLVDYELLKRYIVDGVNDETEKGDNFLLGTTELSKKYFEEWYKPDNKSGMNYPEKIELFINKVLPTRMKDKQRKVLACEVPFEFVYEYGENADGTPKEVILHGFIDRVDYTQKNLDGTYHGLGIIDYKTSKDIYPDNKIKTPLQHLFYNLACLFMYGELAEYHAYDFICLDKVQDNEVGGICSKGWVKRGVKKLNKLLSEVDKLAESEEYAPKPSPLCYWCDFCDKTHSPNASEDYGGCCSYYSMWTPDTKTFAKNEEWGDKEARVNLSSNQSSSTRKLVF